MKMMARPVGLLVAIAVIAASVVYSGNVAVFLHLPSAIFVVSYTYGMLL